MCTDLKPVKEGDRVLKFKGKSVISSDFVASVRWENYGEKKADIRNKYLKD